MVRVTTVKVLRAYLLPAVLLALPAVIGYAQSPVGRATSPGSGASAVKNASSSADRVVLKVGNEQVTQAEFESAIDFAAGPGEAEKERPAEQSRRTLGDNYASLLVLSQQAVAHHLDSSAEVRHQLAIDRVQVLANAEYARLVRLVKPKPEEVNGYYSAHLADYDEVRIRRVFIFNRGGGSKEGRELSPQDARARAEAIRKAFASGNDAKKVAEDFKGSKDVVVDVEPLAFRRGKLPAQMEKAAFALKEGEWSEVQDLPGSLFLVQLVQRRRVEFNEVAQQIENRLRRQKVRAALADLKKNAGVWMDDEYFASAEPPAAPAQTPVSNSTRQP